MYAAPNQEPSTEPEPPSTTATSRYTDANRSKSVGARKPEVNAYSQPAVPANRAAATNAMIFVLAIATPADAAASSLSRTASIPRPSWVRASWSARTVAGTAKHRASTYAQSGFAVSMVPATIESTGVPWVPPVVPVVWTITHWNSSPNARVTSASRSPDNRSVGTATTSPATSDTAQTAASATAGL